MWVFRNILILGKLVFFFRGLNSLLLLLFVNIILLIVFLFGDVMLIFILILVIFWLKGRLIGVGEILGFGSILLVVILIIGWVVVKNKFFCWIILIV